MRWPAIITAAGLGLGVLPTTLALRVAPGSRCSPKCGNVLDDTRSDNIVCKEDEYASGDGLVFEQCVNCELRSNHVAESDAFRSGKETDLQWMLYNIRYATSYCLFGFPDGHVDINPCITETACEPLKDAVTFNELAANSSTYDYCAGWKKDQIPKCLACLRAGDNDIMSNFITVLNAACDQQPLPGKTVSVEGEIFSSDIVNMTDPSPIPTLPPDYFKEGPFGLGAKVGVALGALAFILIVSGFLIVCFGKRKRRAYLRQMEGSNEHKGWAGHVAPQRNPHDETPLSQRPLRSWDDSPVTATTAEKPFQKYFSPYSSQFSSPVSAVDAPNMGFWPDGTPKNPHHQFQQPGEIGIAMGGASCENLEAPSPVKGKERAYDEPEMYGDHGGYRERPEPPRLQHPGYGRSSNSPPRTYTLTAEDAARGDAI